MMVTQRDGSCCLYLRMLLCAPHTCRPTVTLPTAAVITLTAVQTRTSTEPSVMSSHDEQKHSLLNPDEESSEQRTNAPNGRRGAWVHWTAHVLLGSIVVILAATRKAQCSVNESVPTLQDSLPQHVLRRSPTRFNGSIDFRSEWKGVPRPELEAAWNSVTHDGRSPV